MSDGINITIDDAEVIARLRQLAERVGDAGMRPAYASIGELLMESTKRRFETGTAPEGARWAPLAPATVLGRLAEIGGAYTRKTGKLSAKGMRAVTGMRPLVATGSLQDTITWQPIPGGVAVGTNRFVEEWPDGSAAVHQFGSKDGHIPARPFLGLSADDRGEVLDILQRFLEQAAGE